ncbi:GTP cyclohydrolase [Abyssalbus ytuae]|uniref:GTP cyclohydrolase n=1 Tax=Abyssalbus ytuae TaxID=2926907 RepID=A0A9E7D332_9FLAO|nr:GTP cyclohydrolase [Abyssalbus ytuae]UOB17379.1 GTP cyclohydrolase [Abyssalbus ytuae]
MIEIKEVISKREFEKFVKFPFKIYKDSKYWVPPIIKDEIESLDKTKNPAFNTAEVKFYLAYKNNTIVGRVAAIINWDEVKTQQKSKVRFGWFDFIDDIEVSKALLNKVFEFGKEHNLEYAEGPMGFSNLDKVGVLIEGFDHIGTMITWYNHPYYKDHLEKLGFVVEKQYLEHKFPFSNVNPEFFQKAQALIKKRYNLKEINFTKTSEVMPYADRMFDLFNQSYSKLASFTAITEAQKAYFKKKYISFINPEYIKYIEDKNNNLIAFGIVMPSYSEALQKAKGKLWPFGIFHLLKARKHSKNAIFYLIGIHPDYQNKGITAILFNEYYKAMAPKGIKECIRTPELIENTAIQNMWKHFNPVVYKRRNTYKKPLTKGL